MTKTDLVSAVAEDVQITKKVSAEVVDAVLQKITGALAKGEDVSFVGFGTFKVRERAARTGRNPSTGEVMQIAASKAVTFKAGKSLKEIVNQ